MRGSFQSRGNLDATVGSRLRIRAMPFNPVYPGYPSQQTHALKSRLLRRSSTSVICDAFIEVRFVTILALINGSGIHDLSVA